MKTKSCTAALILGACLGLFSGVLQAANNAGGAWTTMYKSGVLHQGDTGTSWRYGLYADIRYTDRLEGINQTTLLPGVGYRLNSRLSFWGGYTYFRSSVHEGTTYDEHRAFQQVSWNMVYWTDARLQSRTRLEQRFRDERNGTDLRLRQQIRLDAQLPFNPDSKYILGDEVFFHVSDAWSSQGYGQNRFFTGFGWGYSNVTVEALYMLQHYRIHSLPDSANHLLVLNFKM